MTWIQYTAVTPWSLAAALSCLASLGSGFAQLEIRRQRSHWVGPVALLFAQLGNLLCVPSLTPPLVTSISGGAMSLCLIAGVDVDVRAYVAKASAVLIAVAVACVAIDITVSGERDDTSVDKRTQIVFWTLSGLVAVASAVASAYTQNPLAKLMLIIGTGYQDVITVSLVYLCFSAPGMPEAIPLLIASGLFSIYLSASSLKVNRAAKHMAVAFAVYNFGVWISSSVISNMTIHGSGWSAGGTILCVAASVYLVLAS